jgi:hypothetical protein
MPRPVEHDVSSAEAWERVRDRVLAEFGGVASW